MKKSRFCRKNVGFLFPLLMVFLFAVSFINVKGATFTVTNTADSGTGSLRQAILDAQAAVGFDTINFNIPGTGVKKIAPLTALPSIVGGGIIIDGTTQTGWAVGNLVVELSGENLSNPTDDGLTLKNTVTATPQSFIRGLVINNFPEAGIYLENGQNITIEGCYIGLDPTGAISKGNKYGIYSRVSGSTVRNITVGGSTAAARNVISGNTYTQIRFFFGSNIFIKGNYIGTDATGNAPPSIADGAGIILTAEESTIGGATAAERNIISGLDFTGIIFSNERNTVQNNYIGVGADGITPLGNNGKGISISNSENLVNRGNHLITENIIAHNDTSGILVSSAGLDSLGNKISNNSMFNNTDGLGIDDVGIDLGDDFRTLNDTDDVDTGGNNLQNFPVLTAATVSSSSINIQGTLNSEASVSYRIEFFANETNLLEGKTYLGFQDVTTDASGNATINATFSALAYSGNYITATATRNVVPFDTSEFSDPFPVSVTSFVVTNTGDSGSGSLRQAIINANASADPNLITFAITPLDGTVKTINLLSPLPTIINPVKIDGLTQNGADCSTQKVELNGTSAGASGDGFTITADNVGIQGFVINRFLGDGIVTSNNKGTLRCNKIGTNAAGSADLGNGGNGILLQSAANENLIESNTLSGNALSGLRVLLSNDNVIRKNIIGLSSDGLNALGNSSGGMLIQGGTRNTVGGVNINDRNIVSTNAGGGILLLATTQNKIKGNYIGTDINGSGTTFGNTGFGIFISTSSNDNIIGGDKINDPNIIARNTGVGIAVDNGGTGNRISRNSIHDNGGLGIDLNNDGVTANDAGDGDTGENNLQNFPVISSAEVFFGGLKVTGTFNSTANTTFRIEVFANPTCDGTNGEGQNFLGTIEVATDTIGNATFSQTLTASGVSVGDAITSTATRMSPDFDTSEFSVCRTATALTIPTLTVTNTNDSGAGSLREAINTANVTPAPDQILFNIPGGGVKTITPLTPLPQIFRPVIIDGLSQPGATCSLPLIELDGISAGVGVDGLDITGSAEIRGLIIGRFNFNGIKFSTTGSNVVTCSRIGTDSTGMLNRGNGKNGIFLNGVSGNTIGGTNNNGNIIHSNNLLAPTVGGEITDSGIRGFNSSNNIIQGNVLGITSNGTNNGQGLLNGIIFQNGRRNLIGGSSVNARNFVANCRVWGIFLQNSSENTVQGNYVGLNQSGVGDVEIDNSVGIRAGASHNNSIIDNVVSNNTGPNGGYGIQVDTSENLVIKGNKIGTDPTGMIAIPNKIGIYLNSEAEATVGGRTAAERNIISGNEDEGILIDHVRPEDFGPPQAVIEGNYIGLAADGETALANDYGIRTVQNQSNVRIGSTLFEAGNFISGNTTAGISLATANTLIQGNRFGFSASFVNQRPNGTGILLNTGANNNTIGGIPTAGNSFVKNGLGIATALGVTSANNNLIQNNFFAIQTSDGIRLGSSNNTIRQNVIRLSSGNGITILTSGAGNRISANTLEDNTLLGIDLGNDSVTANDSGDGDLANNLQNYPVITSATTTIQGSLNSIPNTNFTIEFFRSLSADPSNFGEGSSYLGSLNVTTNGGGNATFNFNPGIVLPAGQFVSATATNSSGDTSEFSQVRQIAGPTAAQVNIEGRVMDKDGRGISRAVVTMTEPNGNVRTTLTNPFGFYRFLSVPGGQTYVFSVSHKSYDFEQSLFTVTVEDEISDLFIVGHRRSEN